MTKSILFALSILSFGAFSQSSFNFNVTGTLKNAPDNSKIYIHHKWDSATLTDSVKVKGGKFTLTGKSAEPNMYWITKTSNINEQPNLIFFVDGGKTSITGNIDSLPYSKVSGGTTQKDYLEYNTLMGGFAYKQQIIVNEYNEAKTKGDNATLNAKIVEYQAMDKEVKIALENYIKTDKSTF